MFGRRFFPVLVLAVALVAVLLFQRNAPRGLAAPTPRKSLQPSTTVRVHVLMMEMPMSLARQHFASSLANQGAVILNEKQWNNLRDEAQGHERANLFINRVFDVQWNQPVVFYTQGVAWQFRMPKTQYHRSIEMEVTRGPSLVESNLQVTIEAKLDSGSALLFGGWKPHLNPHHSDSVLVATIKPQGSRAVASP